MIAIRNLNVWNSTATRLRDFAPTTLDEDMTVTATISTGSPVKRAYGTEVLAITEAAVDLGRLKTVGVPLLDSHQQYSIESALGVVARAWIKDGELRATLKFNETDAGKAAAGMVGRHEINGISAGYRVLEWSVLDADGRQIDPEAESGRWRDDDLQFVATRWELLEASLVVLASDSGAVLHPRAEDRAYLPEAPALSDIKRAAIMRMEARQRMIARASHLHGTEAPGLPLMLYQPTVRTGASIFRSPPQQRQDSDLPPRLIFYGGQRP